MTRFVPLIGGTRETRSSRVSKNLETRQTEKRDCSPHYPVQEVQSGFVSNSISRTPSTDVIGLYPFALRPVLRGASDIPSKYIASSSWESWAEASLCSVCACFVYLPCFRFALALFALPCSVRGPVDLPPCVAHTRLPFIAGAPHLSFVRLLRALQRRHRIRPAASNITSSFLTSITTPKAQIYNTLSVPYSAYKSIRTANIKQKKKLVRLKQILFMVERRELYAKSAALSWRSFLSWRC